VPNYTTEALRELDTLQPVDEENARVAALVYALLAIAAELRATRKNGAGQ
jgi:hypothetical protein